MKKGDPGAWIRERLKPGQTAVDVGAANGKFTQIMAECVGPTGRVFAYEPDPRSLPGLGVLQDRWPQIGLRCCAVSDGSGTARLYQAVTNERSALAAAAVSLPLPGVEPLAVDTVRLEADLQRCDLLKVDAQGWDVKVLRGAGRLLPLAHTVIVECWPEGQRHAGTCAIDLWDLLSAAGFTLEMTRETLADWIATASGDAHINLLAVK